jgi:hypothetical protein
MAVLTTSPALAADRQQCSPYSPKPSSRQHEGFSWRIQPLPRRVSTDRLMPAENKVMVICLGQELYRGGSMVIKEITGEFWWGVALALLLCASKLRFIMTLRLDKEQELRKLDGGQYGWIAFGSLVFATILTWFSSLFSELSTQSFVFGASLVGIFCCWVEARIRNNVLKDSDDPTPFGIAMVVVIGFAIVLGLFLGDGSSGCSGRYCDAMHG